MGLADPYPSKERKAALDKIERLLRKAEMNARLLDGNSYKHRPFAEAYRLLAMLRGER
jgi:hypothetical protein